MHGRGRRLVFELFRVNVVKRRLQESPQEREHTESYASSHRFSLIKVPPPKSKNGG